jgi:hypothetical protein
MRAQFEFDNKYYPLTVRKNKITGLFIVFDMRTQAYYLDDNAWLCEFAHEQDAQGFAARHNKELNKRSGAYAALEEQTKVDENRSKLYALKALQNG